MDGLAICCLEVFAKISSAMREINIEIKLNFKFRSLYYRAKIIRIGLFGVHYNVIIERKPWGIIFSMM